MAKIKKIIAIITLLISPNFLQASVQRITAILACKAWHSETGRTHIANLEKYGQTAATQSHQALLKIISPQIQRQQPSVARPRMTRDQAHQAINATVLAAYEGTSDTTIIENLEQIHGLSKYLDPQQDHAAIRAINLAYENKDKTNIFDTFFWRKAWYEDGLDKFPVPKEVRDTRPTVMIPKILDFVTRSK